MQIRQDHSAYTAMLGLVLAQFDGLVAGYQARARHANDSARIPHLTKLDFIFVNGNGGACPAHILAFSSLNGLKLVCSQGDASLRWCDVVLGSAMLWKQAWLCLHDALFWAWPML